MASNYKLTYGVDLVFTIDATGSMDPILDTVKNHALNFYEDLKNEMLKKKKVIDHLRVKVIAFRDYWYDKDNAMLQTDFFNLPEQAQDFRECINSIKAEGGGDDPEDGLEAIAYAIRSDWANTSAKRRHVIVVWSDAETHNLGFGRKVENYPRNMPEDFRALTRWWGDRQSPGLMDENAKRLLLFTPEGNGWNDIRENWNNVIHYPSEAGSGLESCDYEEILSAISNTI